MENGRLRNIFRFPFSIFIYCTSEFIVEIGVSFSTP